MEVSSVTSKIVHISAYLGPFLTFGWYSAATLYSVLTLQYLDSKACAKTRHLVLGFEASISILYAVESGAIIPQLLSELDSQAKTCLNIYALSQCLVYLVLVTVLWHREKHLWYPHYGVWILSLILDNITYGLLRSDTVSTSFLESAQIWLRGARMITIFSLMALIFTMGRTTLHEYEEQTSLLKQNLVRNTEKSQDVVGAESISAKSTDEAFDNAEKELQDKIRSLEERIKENGDWLTYVKSYFIFVPLIWPSNKPILKLNMLGVGLCILAERALMALKPLGLGAVANYLNQGQEREAFIALGSYGLLRWLDSRAGLHFIRELLWLPVESNAHISLDTASYSHLMSLSCDFHDAKQSGELYASLSQGGSVVRLLESILYNIAPHAADLVVATFYLFFLFDAYLVLLAIATSVLYLGVAVGGSGHQESLLRRRNTADRHRFQVMYDTVGSWRTVVYFNQLTHASKTYEACVRLTYDAWKSLSMFHFTRTALESGILTVSALAAYTYAIYSVLYGGKSLGSFIALQQYWTAFTGRLPSIPEFQRELVSELVDAEELLRLLNTKPTVQDGAKELNFQHGMVEFNRVEFSYSDSKKIISDVTFNAKPGQTIAIVGETGAGKSTILKLLFRFYDISAGSIKVDGQDIRDVTLKSLRDAIGVVPQEPTLFNDTILENVRYARLSASDDDVMNACKAAAVHDKIMTFKHGYSTKVGERGIKLSGGELQRVAIARAILKDSRIVLLDEATSSVDTDTEVKIQEALDRLMLGRTTFIVAHRLSTIQGADKIIVIHDGKIAEQGTLEQLIKMQGRFFNLWTKQINLANELNDGNVTESTH